MIIDKLGVGHYQTKNGYFVFIDWVASKGEEPVHGIVVLEDSLVAVRWTLQGKADYRGLMGKYDLIEITAQEI